MTKNQQIAATMRETYLRRETQKLKVFELKINCHHTSKEDFTKLNQYFKEAKWITNDVIASEDIFHYEYKDHRTIKNLNKDKELVERSLSINTGMHQDIITRIKQDIINESKAKKKGRKTGRLKFKSEVNCIPVRTGSTKIKSSKQISIPGFRKLSVYGLEQFISFPEYEIANANLVRKASGFYILISVCIPKSSIKREKTNKTIGLDFGIKDNIITSDGLKYNCNKQEDDYLKFLQRKLSKKVKGSKRYYRCLNQLKKEYEHLNNQRKDECNKFVHNLLRDYDVIYFQDENLRGWKSSKMKGWGRIIQSSYMGRVKAKLISLEKEGRAFKLPKYEATTQLCPRCGALNKHSLDKRIYTCNCGYTEDRDVHAAKNILILGSERRAECLEQASVERLASGLKSHDFDLSCLDEAKTEALRSLVSE